MKTPTKSVPKKTATKKTATKESATKESATKETAGKSDARLSVNQALQLAGSSVEGLKAYVDYKKEKEETKRSLIEGERDIRLSEHELHKANLQDDQHKRSHDERLVELDNGDKNSLRLHEQTMTQLERKADLESRVLKQLELKQITAEEAALLLYGAQE